MKNEKKKRNWLWVLILLLIVGGFILLFIRGCDGNGDRGEIGVTIVEEHDTTTIEGVKSGDSLFVEPSDEVREKEQQQAPKGKSCRLAFHLSTAL